MRCEVAGHSSYALDSTPLRCQAWVAIYLERSHQRVIHPQPRSELSPRSTDRSLALRICLCHCSIPITIRNFFNLAAAGTVIGDFITVEDEAAGGQFVKGFATIDDVALINVEVRCSISIGSITRVSGSDSAMGAQASVARQLGKLSNTMCCCTCTSPIQATQPRPAPRPRASRHMLVRFQERAYHCPLHLSISQCLLTRCSTDPINEDDFVRPPTKAARRGWLSSRSICCF